MLYFFHGLRDISDGPRISHFSVEVGVGGCIFCFSCRCRHCHCARLSYSRLLLRGKADLQRMQDKYASELFWSKALSTALIRAASTRRCTEPKAHAHAHAHICICARSHMRTTVAAQVSLAVAGAALVFSK